MSYKVLIANRGEIALRALRACRELGIKTVSVYSDVDKGLKHLRFSDETVCIGSAQPSESYLNTASILSAAELTEVDAIYPGYGFLAENPEFANQCNESGFKFIGPSSETIKKMGDKITAKNFVSNYGIPTVPGYAGEIPEDESKFKNIIKKIEISKKDKIKIEWFLKPKSLKDKLSWKNNPKKIGGEINNFFFHLISIIFYFFGSLDISLISKKKNFYIFLFSSRKINFEVNFFSRSKINKFKIEIINRN